MHPDRTSVGQSHSAVPAFKGSRHTGGNAMMTSWVRPPAPSENLIIRTSPGWPAFNVHGVVDKHHRARLEIDRRPEGPIYVISGAFLTTGATSNGHHRRKADLLCINVVMVLQNVAPPLYQTALRMDPLPPSVLCELPNLIIAKLLPLMS